MKKIALEKKYEPPSRKGKKLSEKTRNKISKSLKGKKRPAFSKSWKKKISETLKRKYKTGELKIIINENQRRKMSKSHKGKKSHLWKGGITKEKELLRKGVEWKIWREKVFKRDNYTCRKCKKRGKYLEPHHIKSWSKYPELRFEINNGLTLCHNCHKLTINYGNKKK